MAVVHVVGAAGPGYRELSLAFARFEASSVVRTS